MAEFDAIIVGAGMGGAASAYALTQIGMRVLLLEAGPKYDPAQDYFLDRPDWEIKRFPYKAKSEGKYTYGESQTLDDKRWGHLRSQSHLYGLLNPSTERKFNAYNHVRGVGGSTLHFTGEAHRINPASMKMQSRFSVAADWPINYEQLLPYYQTAERLIGVAGVTREGAACPQLPHPASYAEQVLGEGVISLGMGWQPNSLAVLSRPHVGRPNCNYCSGCNFGCPRRDKGSADQTFIPAALASGRCEIRTGWQVLKVEAGQGDAIDHLLVADGKGDHHRLRAARYVLSCGAVETPRLLLHSELGNESGQVGKNFMETLSFAVLGLHPDPIGSHRGLPSGYICWDYNAPDAIPGVIGGCRLSPVTIEAGFFGASIYGSRVIKGWGKAHKQAMRQSCGNVLGIGGIGDFLPNKKTFINLDDEGQDEYGLPLARINSYLEAQDLHRLDFIRKKSREILQAAGVTELIEQYGSYDFFNATHVAGSCRMGDDPENSVVNRDLRHHRWNNLYIADASVFPSIGGGESPSLTIAALALWMGKRMK